MSDIYKKQTKIGLISFVGNFLMLIANLFLFLFYDLSTCYNSTLVNIWFDVFISILFLISLSKNNVSFRYLQIALYVLTSVFVSITNQSPFDITSMFFLAYAVILFFIYGQVKNSKTKIIFLILILLISLGLNVILNTLYRNSIDFTSCFLVINDNFAKVVFRVLIVVAFIGSFFGLMWATFWEDIKFLLEKSNKLQIALYKSESDAWYGRNVIGVVHNIKNKLTPVYLILEEFSHDERLDEETRKFCKTQIKSVDGLSGLLDKLMYSTKLKHREDIETINVNKTIKSVVEYFKSNLEFKKNVNLTIVQHGIDIYFKCNPMNFCFVIENLIKNSYDNLKSLNREKKIEIEIFNKGNDKYISVKDNGTGISFIKEDEFTGSLLDRGFFKIGNSTKKDGLGYGMEFIKSFIIENKINADIYTKKKFGTEIKIYFDKKSHLL
ncbi:MAG: HAMP domain-containing sensor histidine kinase [Patescibacteria group bacterium]